MKHVGVSELRKMNSKYLRDLKEITVIHHGPQPVRVLIPYAMFLKIQELYVAAEQPKP